MKVFVAEAGRDEVIARLDEATSVAASRLAYVECCAALSRARREGRLTRRQETSARRDLDHRWPQLQAVELDGALAGRAGVLVRELPLRASDAIHLASAELIAGDVAHGVTFACWDHRLWEGARAAGFVVVPESRP